MLRWIRWFDSPGVKAISHCAGDSAVTHPFCVRICSATKTRRKSFWEAIFEQGGYAQPQLSVAPCRSPPLAAAPEFFRCPLPSDGDPQDLSSQERKESLHHPSHPGRERRSFGASLQLEGLLKSIPHKLEVLDHSTGRREFSFENG